MVSVVLFIIRSVDTIVDNLLIGSREKFEHEHSSMIILKFELMSGQINCVITIWA